MKRGKWCRKEIMSSRRKIEELLYGSGSEKGKGGGRKETVKEIQYEGDKERGNKRGKMKEGK